MKDTSDEVVRESVVDAQGDAAGIQIKTARIRRISHMIELARACDKSAPAIIYRGWNEFLASFILGAGRPRQAGCYSRSDCPRCESPSS